MTSRGDDSVDASVIYGEGSLTMSRQTTTGAPASAFKSGVYGQGTVSSSLGLVQLNFDSTGDFSNSSYVGGGGSWNESYVINGTPGQQGTYGTANFTFSLEGSFTASNVGVGSGQTVNYSFFLPAFSTTIASAEFAQNSFSGTLPPKTFMVPYTFLYGSPFDVGAALSSTANPGRSGLPDGSAGHVHLTLQNLGFTVQGGSYPASYTASSASGTSAGASLAANSSYGSLSLPNNVGHQSVASLLDGTATGARDVALNFIAAPANPLLVSDVLDVQGIGGDQYVLQLQYDEAAAIAQFGSEQNLMLSWLNPAFATWQNAVDGNSGGSSLRIDGAYNPAANYALGTWGQDTTTNVVWAVVNHNSEFSVTAATPAPEPATSAFLAGGGLLLALRRRRR